MLFQMCQVYDVFVSSADVHVDFVVCFCVCAFIAYLNVFFFLFFFSVSDNKSQILPSLAPTDVKDEKLSPYINFPSS